VASRAGRQPPYQAVRTTTKKNSRKGLPPQQVHRQLEQDHHGDAHDGERVTGEQGTQGLRHG
jgi:hypothetical protein